MSASFQLGLLHMEGGKGLGDPNPAEAARFWKNSAALGHADSIFNLGIFFLNGFGMDQDIVGGGWARFMVQYFTLLFLTLLGIRMIQLARNANPSLAMPPPLDVLTEFEVQVLVEHMIAAKSNNASADDKNTTIRDENVDNQKFLMFNIILAKRMAAEKLAANGQGPSSATPSSDLAKGAKKSLSTSTPSSSSSSSSKKKKKKSSSKKNKQESEKLSSAEEGSLLANLDGGIVVSAGILVAAVSIGFYAWLRK